MTQPDPPNVGETCGRCPSPKVEMYAVGGLMPAQPGWAARFTNTPDPDDDELGEEGAAQVGDPPPYPPYAHFDVLAYDGHGYAMVIDEDEGRLRRATSYDNFLTLVRPDGTPTIRGYLPSMGGWQVRTRVEGEEPEVRPVIGWAMTDLSDALPIVADTTGPRQAAFLVDPDDAYYREVAHIPPAQWAPIDTPSGRNGGRPTPTPNGRKVGGEGDAQVGGPAGEGADAQPAPNGRQAATPTRTPKGSPSGRPKRTPKATPKVDELTPTLRVRLAQLGEQFPGDVPGRDAVIAHMAAQGVAGFTSKGQVDMLIRVLRNDRAQFAHINITEEVTA